MIWQDMIWFDMIWYDVKLIWYDMIWYDLIWCEIDMIWYDMDAYIIYDMIYGWYQCFFLIISYLQSCSKRLRIRDLQGTLWTSELRANRI